VASIRNPRVRVIDASSAHRTHPDWVYGFPEMSSQQSGRIARAPRVSNPGCYPTGAIALLRPHVESGCLSADAPLAIHAVSGYSGRRREGIEAHEGPGAATALSFQTYGLGLEHKHVPEIRLHSNAMCACSTAFRPAR
jgi:N-acetyl-gamma-glutamyl-phosphate reductase